MFNNFFAFFFFVQLFETLWISSAMETTWPRQFTPEMKRVWKDVEKFPWLNRFVKD